MFIKINWPSLCYSEFGKKNSGGYFFFTNGFVFLIEKKYRYLLCLGIFGTGNITGLIIYIGPL